MSKNSCENLGEGNGIVSLLVGSEGFSDYETWREVEFCIREVLGLDENVDLLDFSIINGNDFFNVVLHFPIGMSCVLWNTNIDKELVEGNVCAKDNAYGEMNDNSIIYRAKVGIEKFDSMGDSLGFCPQENGIYFLSFLSSKFTQIFSEVLDRAEVVKVCGNPVGRLSNARFDLKVCGDSDLVDEIYSKKGVFENRGVILSDRDKKVVDGMIRVQVSNELLNAIEGESGVVGDIVSDVGKVVENVL